MDAVTYIRERGRMCKAFETCEECICGGCSWLAKENPEKLVETVEKWSKEHPPVTNGDMVWRLIPSTVRSTKKCRAKEDFPYPENAPCSKDHYVITVTADWWDAEYKGE